MLCNAGIVKSLYPKYVSSSHGCWPGLHNNCIQCRRTHTSGLLFQDLIYISLLSAQQIHYDYDLIFHRSVVVKVIVVIIIIMVVFIDALLGFTGLIVMIEILQLHTITSLLHLDMNATSLYPKYNNPSTTSDVMLIPKDLEALLSSFWDCDDEIWMLSHVIFIYVHTDILILSIK